MLFALLHLHDAPPAVTPQRSLNHFTKILATAPEPLYDAVAMSAATIREGRTMHALRLLLSLSAYAAFALRLCPAQEPAEKPPAQEKTSPADNELAEQRLKFMKEALGRYELRLGPDRTPAKLLATPLLRWSNPVSGVQDGLVGLYTTGGRPTAVVQFAFHHQQFQVHEFYAVTPVEFEMLRGAESIWKPAKAIFAFQDLKDGPPPAKSTNLRLTQMRQIAAEFTVTDKFGWDKPETQILRLMPQPLHRYTDEAAGVVEGALFSFAMGTNPEAVLLLELVQNGDALKWQFGFAPMTIYELKATRKDEKVWSIGERKIFNSYDTPFRVGPYPPEPDEVIPK